MKWEGTQDFSVSVFQEASCSSPAELEVSEWEEVYNTDF